MAQLNLKVINPIIEDFELEGIYRNDVWDVSQLDIYKNSSEDMLKKFESRGHRDDNNFYFDTCENEYIRWELKYYFYTYSNKKISLVSFNEYYQRVKVIINFINANMLHAKSLKEVDINTFTFWLECNGYSTKYKAAIKISKDMEKVRTYGKSKFIKTLNRIISYIENYQTKNVSPYDLDVWRLNELIPNYPDDAKIKTYTFSGIIQERIKSATKAYVKARMLYLSASAINGTISSINIFSRWLDETYPEIDSLEDLNRDIIEDYIAYLKLEVDIKSSTFSAWMSSLNVFLSYCMLLDVDFAPTTTLLTKEDYRIKAEQTIVPYSDEEIQLMVKNINTLPNQFARIFFIHLHVGMRINELCRLKISQLTGNSGKYKLLINQTKTFKGNSVPLHDRVATAIISAHTESQKQFGDNVEYIFASSETQHISERTYSEAMNKMLYENNVRYNGKRLHFLSHKIRKTVCSKYANILDINVAASMIGDTAKTALRHYAEATEENVVKAMEPLIRRNKLLIDNIGNIHKIKSDKDLASLTPLPNGRCNMGSVCEHANACYSCKFFIPEPKYLINYSMELAELEAARKLAEMDSLQRQVEQYTKTINSLKAIITKLKGENTNESNT